MNSSISIQINNEPFLCDINMSIEALLLYLDFNISLIAIEYNKTIIPRNLLKKIYLKEGDKLEIVTIVGGG